MFRGRRLGAGIRPAPPSNPLGIGRRKLMSVEFTCACPDCGHNLVAVANPGNPYDWDWEDCVCQQRAWKKR